MSLLNKEEENQLSLIKDPFRKDCVDHFGMHMSTSFTGKKYFWGTVEFKNGQTSGEQRVGDFDTFEELYIEMKQVLESIK